MDNPYSPPKSKITEDNVLFENKQPAGLSGWLIVLGIFMLYNMYDYISILISIYNIATMYNIFNAQGFGLFSKLGVIIAMIVSVILFFCWLRACILYFQKKHSFKRIFLILVAAKPILIIAAIILAACITEGVTPRNEIALAMELEIFLTIVKSFTAAIFWILYILLSRRVENTFIN